MGYVLAAILVLLIVAAGVTFFVLKSTRAGRESAAADRGHGEGVPGSDAAIVAPDDQTPLGDTDQHAGLLEKFGINPADLLGKLGGGSLPGL